MLERSRRLEISLAHITFGTQHLDVELLKYPAYSSLYLLTNLNVCVYETMIK